MNEKFIELPPDIEPLATTAMIQYEPKVPKRITLTFQTGTPQESVSEEAAAATKPSSPS
jgi:hypothetical protein